MRESKNCRKCMILILEPIVNKRLVVGIAEGKPQVGRAATNTFLSSNDLWGMIKQSIGNGIWAGCVCLCVCDFDFVARSGRVMNG